MLRGTEKNGAETSRPNTIIVKKIQVSVNNFLPKVLSIFGNHKQQPTVVENKSASSWRNQETLKLFRANFVEIVKLNYKASPSLKFLKKRETRIYSSRNSRNIISTNGI